MLKINFYFCNYFKTYINFGKVNDDSFFSPFIFLFYLPQLCNHIAYHITSL